LATCFASGAIFAGKNKRIMTNFDPLDFLSTINLKKGSMVKLRKFWTVGMILVFGLGACQNDKEPEGVLSKEQLSALFVEFYLAEARLGNGTVVRDSALQLFLPFEESFLKEKGVSDSVLRKTYTYYFSNPSKLEQIYDAVIDTLSLREQRATEPSPK
jgi:Domain of unknown function (DUF4296)